MSVVNERLNAVRRELLDGLSAWIRTHDPAEALAMFAPLGWTDFSVMCLERGHLSNALSFEELFHAWLLAGGQCQLQPPGR